MESAAAAGLDYRKPFDTAWKYSPNGDGDAPLSALENVFFKAGLHSPLSRAIAVGTIGMGAAVVAGVGERVDGSWKSVGIDDGSEDATLFHPVTIGLVLGTFAYFRI